MDQDGEEIEIDASGAAPKSQGMGKHQEFHLLGFEMNEILKNSLASNVVINVSPNLPDVDRLMEVRFVNTCSKSCLNPLRSNGDPRQISV